MAVIKADCPSASYVKLYLPACNAFNGLEAALLSCNGSVHLYLYVLTLLFPPSPDEDHCDVKITFNNETLIFTAERLQGGQSLLLPDEAMVLIMGALLDNTCVDIKVGRYETTLIPDNFQKTYSLLFPKAWEMT